MKTKDAIQSELCTLFNTITEDNSFVQSDPRPAGVVNTPRVQGLYGNVNIANISQIGSGDYRSNENITNGANIDLLQKVEGQRLMRVSVNTYRQGAFDLMNRIYNALQRDSTIEYLTNRLLGYSTRSDIRDLSTIIGTGLEERYQMDLFLFTVATDEEIVYAIDSLTINAVIDNGTQQYSTILEVSNP